MGTLRPLAVYAPPPPAQSPGRPPSDCPATAGSGDSVGAALADVGLDLVLFASATDVQPRPRRAGWCDLAGRLGRHATRHTKDGPGWSPVRYRAGATRSNAGVVCVTAVVLDVDHAEPDWPLLEGFAFAAHTTHSHRPEDSRWRVGLPLARPTPAAAWGDVWRRAVHRLFPGADPACKDPARLHYWPSCLPGAPRAVRRGAGAWLDPDRLPPAPPPPAPRAPGPGPGVRGGDGPRGRPGDDFGARSDWREVLEPHGWRRVAERGGEGYWCRPGKARGVSATTGYAGGASLYVFSSNAPPFAPGESYSKFAAYALLEHGGDFARAVQALAARGFGRPGRPWRGEDGIRRCVVATPGGA